MNYCEKKWWCGKVRYLGQILTQSKYRALSDPFEGCCFLHTRLLQYSTNFFFLNLIFLKYLTCLFPSLSFILHMPPFFLFPSCPSSLKKKKRKKKKDPKTPTKQSNLVSTSKFFPLWFNFQPDPFSPKPPPSPNRR